MVFRDQGRKPPAIMQNDSINSQGQVNNSSSGSGPNASGERASASAVSGVSAGDIEITGNTEGNIMGIIEEEDSLDLSSSVRS